MWKEVLTAVWLVPMSIMDTRSKRVPVWMLWIGTVAAIGVLLYDGINGGLNGWQECRALLPGVILLAVAYATGKAGTADGVILMLLGVFMGYEDCVAASLGGLFLIALFSVVLLTLRRVKKDTRIPFVPFLAVGWLIVVCGRWGT
ncbi:MAG: hypothetical protein K2J60_08855 [Acetatifactor sp.]|nr:hypothetical protein [Acetatifactor sp.]